ncbi:PIPK domain-containing protein, partial [Durusdinium trenchii]
MVGGGLELQLLNTYLWPRDQLRIRGHGRPNKQLPQNPADLLEIPVLSIDEVTCSWCSARPPWPASGLKLHCENYLKKIRDVFEVPTPQEILETNHIDLSAAEEGTGRSGAKMLFSKDKKFIIKTMSARDLGAFIKVVEKYTAHLVSHASESAMMRYYAILE